MIFAAIILAQLPVQRKAKLADEVMGRTGAVSYTHLPDKKKISEGIDQDMKDRGRLLRRVYYVPGIGGTTLMRRLAWEYRGKYPTFILNRMNDHTCLLYTSRCV